MSCDSDFLTCDTLCLDENQPVDFNSAKLVYDVKSTDDTIYAYYGGPFLPEKGFLLFTGFTAISTPCQATMIQGQPCSLSDCACQCPIQQRIWQPCEYEIVFYGCRELLPDGFYRFTNLIRGMRPYGCDTTGDASLRRNHLVCTELTVGARNHYYDCLNCDCFTSGGADICAAVNACPSIATAICNTLALLPNAGLGIPLVTQFLGADCQIYTLPAGGGGSTDLCALIASSIYPLTNLAVKASDCIAVYSCGDFCLTWDATATASSYKVEEDGVLLGQPTTPNFSVTSTGVGNRNFTVTPMFCGDNITGAPISITVDDQPCVQPCTNILVNPMNCFYAWTGGLPVPYGTGAGPMGCNPTSSIALMTLPTGDFNIQGNFATGAAPQHVGASWDFVLFIDGVQVTSLATVVLIDPGQVNTPFFYNGTTAAGVHTFEIRIRQLSGAPGYPFTVMEQQGAALQYCPQHL